MQIDTLIHARWVIPVHKDTVLEHHSVAILNGRIVAILPQDEASKKYQASQVVDCNEHAIIPGFINAHTHVAMNLLKGIADDLALMDWLQNHIWPIEAKWLGEQFVQDGTRLAMAEMIRSGTTCFNDMYMFPDVTARAAAQAGMRACVGAVVIDFPTPWASDADEYIHKGLTLCDEYKNDPLIKVTLAPHAPYTVSDGPLQQLATLSNELDLPVHIHLHETEFEVEDAERQSGKRPFKRLEELGLIGPNTIAVHMTQLTDAEIKTLAKSNASVAHCPASNMKLASGFCPTAKLSRAGVNIAIGTDGAASNNDLDMFSEMRLAALIAKGYSGDATALNAHEVLKMATLNGAKALNLADITGSLHKGKSADITAVRMNRIESMPVFDPVSHLVYACGRDAVEHVWVAGKLLLHHRKLTTLDEGALLKSAAAWQAKIAASGTKD